jgi:hypothetical protein
VHRVVSGFGSQICTGFSGVSRQIVAIFDHQVVYCSNSSRAKFPCPALKMVRTSGLEAVSRTLWLSGRWADRSMRYPGRTCAVRHLQRDPDYGLSCIYEWEPTTIKTGSPPMSIGDEPCESFKIDLSRSLQGTDDVLCSDVIC